MELKGFKEFDKILMEIKEKAPETTKKCLAKRKWKKINWKYVFSNCI